MREVSSGAKERHEERVRPAADGVGKRRSTPATISVLLAEDDELIRDALLAVIDAEPDLTVVGTAESAEKAVELAFADPPDVALLDVRMPGGGGAHAARRISDECPETKIVAVSAHDDAETIGEMVEAGARGYVTKDAPPQQLVDTIRRCAAGESVFTPVGASELMGRYVRSSRSMADAQRARREREERLRAASQPGSVSPVFQPIVDLGDGTVRMFEALTRFPGAPEKNTAEWFEEAVELDMSTEFELATMAQAIAALSGVEQPVHVSLNVSPETLLSPALSATLGAVDPARVVVEVTEYAEVRDYDEMRTAIEQLRERGARMAIDDAGAGFASLRHILDLDPDLIKLDISLVRGIDTDRKRRALAKGLISFASEIGAEIVAEGIETRQELVCLQQLGVGLGQGYALARPMPLAEALQVQATV